MKIILIQPLLSIIGLFSNQSISFASFQSQSLHMDIWFHFYASHRFRNIQFTLSACLEFNFPIGSVCSMASAKSTTTYLHRTTNLIRYRKSSSSRTWNRFEFARQNFSRLSLYSLYTMFSLSCAVRALDSLEKCSFRFQFYVLHKHTSHGVYLRVSVYSLKIRYIRWPLLVRVMGVFHKMRKRQKEKTRAEPLFYFTAKTHSHLKHCRIRFFCVCISRKENHFVHFEQIYGLSAVNC